MTEINPIKFIVRVSRGRLGGSTFLTALAERAIYSGRPVLLGDGDRHNKGISSSPLYAKHGLPLPTGDDRIAMQAWLTTAFEIAIEKQKNLLLDIGGGDELMQEYATTTGLVETAEALGATVVGLFMCGTEPGDMDFIHQLWRSRKFRPHKCLIVANEWAAPEGLPPQAAFTQILDRAQLDTFEGTEVNLIKMRRLLPMNEVVASGLTFHDVAEGKKGAGDKPLGPMQRFWVRRWLNDIDAEIEDNGIQGWVP